MHRKRLFEVVHDRFGELTVVASFKSAHIRLMKLINVRPFFVHIGTGNMIGSSHE
jgi:hypothetical protein